MKNTTAIKEKIEKMEKIVKDEKEVLEYFENPKYEVKNGHVVRLEILHSKLATLPQNFGNLFYLKELNLCNNHLAKLPQCIGSLIYLENLYLKRNRLRTK